MKLTAKQVECLTKFARSKCGLTDAEAAECHAATIAALESRKLIERTAWGFCMTDAGREAWVLA